MMTILNASVGTSLAAFYVHRVIIGSGTQPTTMCAEYKAAETVMNVTSSSSHRPDLPALLRDTDLAHLLSSPSR